MNMYFFLNKRKLKEFFIPPKKAIENKIVLDVNKIHFILEKEQNRKKILNEIINDLKKENLIKYLEKLKILTHIAGLTIKKQL